MKDGAKNIYKNLLRQEINCVKCIKDEDHIMLIKEDEITEKWENYFDRFYNECDTWDWSELSKSTEDRNCCPLGLCTGRVGWGQYI